MFRLFIIQNISRQFSPHRVNLTSVGPIKRENIRIVSAVYYVLLKYVVQNMLIKSITVKMKKKKYIFFKLNFYLH